MTLIQNYYQTKSLPDTRPNSCQVGGFHSVQDNVISPYGHSCQQHRANTDSCHGRACHCCLLKCGRLLSLWM
jgi:hypothetical protein